MFDWSLNAFMLLVGYLPCKRKEKPFQKTHFWNDLNCVKWDVKPYSLTSNITLQIIVHSSEWHICITSENIIHRQQSCCQGRLPVYLWRKPFFFWYWDQGGLTTTFWIRNFDNIGAQWNVLYDQSTVMLQVVCSSLLENILGLFLFKTCLTVVVTVLVLCHRHGGGQIFAAEAACFQFIFIGM